ncbi:MAG: antibiotic biosynthesis monooxygenase [Tepidisphaeraceae bacterium]|jgi:heme-degrading monooxygenase HmoA
MTTIGMHYDVIPGKEQEFEQGFDDVLEKLKQTLGHVESHLFKSVAAPGSYLIMSQWKSREDFDAFLRSDAFKQVTAWGRAEILRGRPKHKIYSE